MDSAPPVAVESLRDESGYLLIEFVVVGFIVLVGLLGILDEAASAIRGNRVADQQSISTALAQSKIEDLVRQRFTDVANGADATSLAPDGTAGGIYTRSWQITPQTVNGVSSKQVAVTVSYPQVRGTASTVLTTEIVDIPDYGPGFPTVVSRSWHRP